jgi:hypothetical protein
MDEDSQFRRMIAWTLGVTGVGVLVAAVMIPPPYVIYVVAVILVLALLLFGGYILWRRIRARRRRERFSSALEVQTAAAPKAISDPNQRADLDRVRQKFQKGLQEYKSRGKDIYKLPWYVIIGESGSGKTEAIRHSGIDFPPGLQDELQGSGGTVNMDWWFTNRGIILDTAGSMIFNQARAGEAPEWREFLRLLKRARPRCPINGLFLVLSVESFIRDSADTIKDKASRLAQQLDLIQRTLDVRFPVYLLVTKCDLLIGFREFFDSIDDPLLQHQMFGWSNPEPLDAHFRPDLVEQHLKSVAERLRRRRLALLRTGTSGASRSGDTSHFFASSSQLARGPAGTRRLDEVDALFALPESVMRLAPRLRRYLETVFVAGEWSAKPVFLRGMYFTSSMREGKALDEAIAFATGLPLDQLPEDRSWEKNKAFFLRDLFIEKVFRESGLVTRATNTLKLLRQRQLAILGSAAIALLVLLVFAGFAGRSLKHSLGEEEKLWQAGADGKKWENGVWIGGSIVTRKAQLKFSDAQTNRVGGGQLSVIEFHRKLRELATKKLSGDWFFRPVSRIVGDLDDKRADAAQLLFQAGVLRPLIFYTRDKLQGKDPQTSSDIERHRDALWSLLQIEADRVAPSSSVALIASLAYPTKHLGHLFSYLTDGGSSKLDETLVRTFMGTYAGTESDKGKWPPPFLLGGDKLASNLALKIGLEKYSAACVGAQTNIVQELLLLNGAADGLNEYHKREREFLSDSGSTCLSLKRMESDKATAEANWALLEATNRFAGPLTNLTARYKDLAARAEEASGSDLRRMVEDTQKGVSNAPKGNRTDFGLGNEILGTLSALKEKAGDRVLSSLASKPWVSALDTNCLTVSTNNIPAYKARWELYTRACALASNSVVEVTERDIGDLWRRLTNLSGLVKDFHGKLEAYEGPRANEVKERCKSLAQQQAGRLEEGFLAQYRNQVRIKLEEFTNRSSWSIDDVTNVQSWFAKIENDWKARNALRSREIVEPIREDLTKSRQVVLNRIDDSIRSGLGFPVLLDASPAKPMGLRDLSRLRSLLDGLLNELKDPGWESDSPSELSTLQGHRDRYSPVVTSLVHSNGSAVEWKIFFVPPNPEQKADEGIRKYFRQALISIGPQASDWKELPSFKTRGEVGKGGLDSTVKLSFRRNPESRAETPVDYGAWGILQWIREGNPERLEDGHKWKFRLGLKGQRQTENVAGDMVFEVELLDAALPRLEDWRSK